ncbi:MAG: aspartate carbamoyltransferase [Candidatus Marsarchaeota archaeon]|nr:aspartate carbamoyltransferase [Candidatus Marsarchaeota archaeon]
MADLISIRDLDKPTIEKLLSNSEKMEKNLFTSYDKFPGKVAATLFFEPSTRTHLSFQTAAQRLGMSVVPYYHASSSSSKGESLSDTLKIVDGYADLLIIRHPAEGSARYAAEMCRHPVINAGDGGNQHPTQTLIDLYTIQKAKGKIKGLNVSLIGDLSHARAMRSLLYGLAMFGAKVKLIAPRGLEMDSQIVEEVKEKFDAQVEASEQLDLAGADVAYVCRIQKERFSDPYQAAKMQASFRIMPELLLDAKADMILLHPLPKIDEIPAEVDASPHAHYFQQASHGVPVRMAVLEHALKEG